MSWAYHFDLIVTNIADVLDSLDYDVVGEEENVLLVSREDVTFRLTIEQVDHA